MRFWYRLGSCLAWIMIRTFGRVELIGSENIPPFGSLVVTPNHQSNMDPPLLTTVFKRPLWFMGKRTLFSNWLFSYFLRGFHVHPVDRDGRDLEAIRWARTTLQNDRVLVLFPEGTRKTGGLGEGSDGATYLAIKNQATVLPVAIIGTETIPAFIRIAFPLRRLKVIIGEPYSFPAIEGDLNREALHSLTKLMMNRIAELLPPSRRGLYRDL